jgi:hypothetical protein
MHTCDENRILLIDLERMKEDKLAIPSSRK